MCLSTITSILWPFHLHISSFFLLYLSLDTMIQFQFLKPELFWILLMVLIASLYTLTFCFIWSLEIAKYVGFHINGSICTFCNLKKVFEIYKSLKSKSTQQAQTIKSSYFDIKIALYLMALYETISINQRMFIPKIMLLWLSFLSTIHTITVTVKPTGVSHTNIPNRRYSTKEIIIQKLIFFHSMKNNISVLINNCPIFVMGIHIPWSLFTTID